MLEEGDAVHHRHRQIEDDQIEARTRQQRPHGELAVRGLDDAVAFAFEQARQRIPQVRLVVDDQDFCGNSHATSIRPGRPSARLLRGSFVQGG